MSKVDKAKKISVNKNVAIIGHPTYPVVCQLKQWKSKRYLDIRKHYVDYKTEDLKPTTKGIMLDASVFGEFVSLIDKKEIDILDWLNSGPLSQEEQLQAKIKEASDLIAKSRLDAKKFTHATENNTGGGFFDVRTMGGRPELIINENHLLYEEIKKLNESSTELIMKLIMSFQHVIDLYDEQEINSLDLINDLKVSWSTALSNYISKK
jgi:hypothetical protein